MWLGGHVPRHANGLFILGQNINPVIIVRQPYVVSEALARFLEQFGNELVRFVKVALDDSALARRRDHLHLGQ